MGELIARCDHGLREGAAGGQVGVEVDVVEQDEVLVQQIRVGTDGGKLLGGDNLVGIVRLPRPARKVIRAGANQSPPE